MKVRGYDHSRVALPRQVEFLVLTRWASTMATVATYDEKVRHYDVLEELAAKDLSAAHIEKV